MGFHAKHVPRKLDGYGYVVPRCERRHALACSWSSTKLNHRAPAGRVLLRVFIGRAGDEIDERTGDSTLVKMARDELKTSMNITEPPVFERVFRFVRGMPQYTVGHLPRMDRLDRTMEDTPGVFLAGNSYRGIGIPDAIRSGHTAAERVLGYLREPDQT